MRGRETAHFYGRAERTERNRKENNIHNRFGNPILIQSFFDRISNRRMLHQHGDRLELCIIDSGAGNFQLGRTKHRVRAGSLIICNPDMLHGLSVDGSLFIDCYSVTIAGLQIENLPENYLIPDTALPVLDLTGETAFTMRSMFRLLHLHAKSGTDSSSEICNMLLYTIFMLTRDWMSGNGQIYRKNENSNTGKIAGEILDYLEQHYLEITNLDKVAADLQILKEEGPVTLTCISHDQMDKMVVVRANIVRNTAFPTCRTQVEMDVQGDIKDIDLAMDGRHWMMVYGEQSEAIRMANEMLGIETVIF